MNKQLVFISFPGIALAMLAGCSSRVAESPTCEALVPEVIQMSKGRGGPQIIEINGVKTLHHMSDSTGCNGTAITSVGDAFVEFGTDATAQGKQVLRITFPHGL